jgi:glycosyltransferase involved in cell wall biosynthesis
MAHGKPVVAADATALPETVGEGGVLFEPKNPADMAAKIIRLLDDIPVRPAEAASAAGLIPAPLSEEDRTRLKRGTIAFVGPRYGLEILGGAERMLRGWAEHLADHGYRTEVLTTCTADMGDWSNHFAPGVEQINGITVRRFSTDRVDTGAFHLVLSKANGGEHVTYDDEQAFARNNLQSSALNQYLHEHADDYVSVVFAPYLFGTSYWGMQALPDKAIILPCLHDEPSARLSVFREMLEGAAGIFFNAYPEHALAVDSLHIANSQQLIVGYGFDTDGKPGDAAGFRARHNLPEQILFYSGRLEQGKNVPLLLEYFVRYKTEHPGPLTLVLAGTGDIPIPQRSDIVPLGFQSAELPHAYAAASIFCMPSVNESFSIVIMESWLQSRPILVHADCAVTSDHVIRSGGGYIFGDYSAFAGALQQVLNDPADADQRGQRGRAYVEQYYAWDVVTERFVQGIAAFTAPRSEYTRLAQHAIRRALAFTHARIDDALLAVIEQAQAELGTRPNHTQQQQLLRMTRVGQPDYVVRSGLPIFGGMIAWLRRHLTSHLREPYLDPIVQRQEKFNTSLVETLLPMLEQSLHEQRRLRREVATLRHQLGTIREASAQTNQTEQKSIS